MTERSEALAAALEPVLADLGLDLYDLEIAGRGPTQTLRVMIDRKAGIDLDAITAATQAISPVLDDDPAAALLRDSYTLEVTSPGLERPLRTPAHFHRAIGSTASVKTGFGPDASRRRGVVVAADDAGFDLEVDDGSRERVAYGDVIQARTVFEWGPKSKSKTKTKTKSKSKSKSKSKTKTKSKTKSKTKGTRKQKVSP